MPSVYGYSRVSSESQAESGLSLADQRSVIAARCKQLRSERALTIGAVYQDAAVSGTRYELRSRPEGGRLDTILRVGDHVVIAKLDRAFRNQRDCMNTLHDWERRGITVHLLDLNVDTSTPLGKLFVGLLAAFAQWESARIGERIRDAKRAMREAGRSVNGHRKLGYQLVRGKLVADEREQRLGNRILRMRNRGLLWRQIAEKLNQERVSRVKRHRSQILTTWNAQACARLAAACQHRWRV